MLRRINIIFKKMRFHIPNDVIGPVVAVVMSLVEVIIMLIVVMMVTLIVVMMVTLLVIRT